MPSQIEREITKKKFEKIMIPPLRMFLYIIRLDLNT
jgi:hypothetical protein